MQRKITFARQLRRVCTDAERKLWRYIRNRQISGLKFRRQHPIGSFILDFYCEELRFGIELDGGQHYSDSGQAQDTRRTAMLREKGVRILRFSNLDVLNNIEGVVTAILQSVAALTSAFSRKSEAK
jgi:very-short-patch-repair endonuclease